MRVDQVDRVQLLGAIVALVATGAVETAVGAGAFDVAVGQVAAIGGRIHLGFRDFADQPLVCQNARELLGQRVVLGRGGAAEVIEGQAEAVRDPGLDIVHFGAVVRDGLAGLGRGKLCRSTVFVGRAEKEHFVAAAALVARENIGGQLGAHEIAEVFDPVDIGNGRGDEVPCHGMPFA